jgi:crotonobetainyl-CoA:carnitine CoA-transferase CaiB-like acyl-CoA transferase
MISAGDSQALLTGVKVIDLTSVVFGPFTTQILADLGAEVIKVETPVGDAFRYAGLPAVTTGLGPSFMALNRGKRSIILDLKNADDLQVMKGLIADADVFALNVRGKAVERLGLDYEAVKAINPNIIYAHCVGFGQDGPYADLQAYDDVIQAATGTTTLLSRVDGNPAPRFLPSLVADKVAGLHGAYAILAAIIHRMRTGEGQKVEIPMMEAFSNFMLLEHLGGLTYDPPNAEAGYFRQLDPDRQPFPTADGHISLVPYTDPSLPLMFTILGDAAFLNDPKFATPRDRFANMALLYRRIAELTRNFTTAALLDACHAAQIPAQAVRDLGDILEEPHLAATGFFKRRTHPTEGDYFEMKPPIKFSAAETVPQHFPPQLGEHSDDIRAEQFAKGGSRI